MKKRKHGRRFTISATRQSSQQRAIEMEPEDLVVYVRRAEKDVLPIIKEMQLSPGAAQFLLAQQTQILVTGDPRLTTESGMAIAIRVLDLWRDGYYTPQVQRIPTPSKRHCWSYRKAPKQRETTRPGSNRSPLRTEIDRAASVKWLGES